jgi:biotin synthase
MELAKQTKESVFGKKVWFRGIIEFSNICHNNCYYCGIRSDNTEKESFIMSHDEILSCVDFIHSANYGSVVFQSGEIKSESFKDFLLTTVESTHRKYPKLGITISCGEFDRDFLKNLKLAGANRYLLRIETSNNDLYQKLHPNEMLWDDRYACLKNLQQLDYQVGTGIMIGLPGQTLDDLFHDLKFFVDNQFDMFGVGLYVTHQNTPIGSDPAVVTWWNNNKEKHFNRLLNFLSILRILLPTVNIAATTSCDVFHPSGRMMVLNSSGNIIMPVVTPQKYRHHYLLYDGKPCMDETKEICYDCTIAKLKKAGLEPALGEHGTSPFYIKKNT